MGTHQLDEVGPHRGHMPRGGGHDALAALVGDGDQGAPRIVGGRPAHHQPALLHAAQLMGQPTALPADPVAQPADPDAFRITANFIQIETDAGVIGIALVNLVVSFSLALYVALQSRRVGSAQILRLGMVLLRRLAPNPLAFVSAPRDKPAG